MIKLLFGSALALGLASVVWMGSVFVGTDAAALTITAIIGGVYLIGVFELLRYRAATSGKCTLGSQSRHFFLGRFS